MGRNERTAVRRLFEEACWPQPLVEVRATQNHPRSCNKYRTLTVAFANPKERFSCHFSQYTAAFAARVAHVLAANNPRARQPEIMWHAKKYHQPSGLGHVVTIRCFGSCVVVAVLYVVYIVEATTAVGVCVTEVRTVLCAGRGMFDDNGVLRRCTYSSSNFQCFFPGIESVHHRHLKTFQHTHITSQPTPGKKNLGQHGNKCNLLPNPARWED